VLNSDSLAASSLRCPPTQRTDRGAAYKRRPQNNAMNQTNRGVPGMKVGRASGEPVLAEVGPPFILSLDVAGYCSVRRTAKSIWRSFVVGQTAACLKKAV
jgi:hypothetical protein